MFDIRHSTFGVRYSTFNIRCSTLKKFAPQVQKAIQLSINGKLLEQFAQEMAVKIIDLTTFAQEQKKLILQKNITQLQVPQEWIYEPRDARIRTRIGLTNNEHV